MHRSSTWFIARTIVCALVAASALTWPVAAAAQTISPSKSPAPPAGWDTFTANVTVSRSEIDAEGHVVKQSLQPTSFRVVRSRASTGWKTEMTLLQMAGPVLNTASVPSENPFLVSRLEFDRDGVAPRLYNKRGELVRTPTDTDRRTLALPPTVANPQFPASPVAIPAAVVGGFPRGEWVDSLLSTPDKVAVRRASLEQRFGAPTAQAGTLSEYRAPAGDVVCQLLADATWAVITSVTCTRGALVLSKSLYSYESRTGGILVRTSTRSEFPSDTANQQLVTKFDLTNVTFAKRGVQ